MILVLPYFIRDAHLLIENLNWMIRLDGPGQKLTALLHTDGTAPSQDGRIARLAKQAFTNVLFSRYQKPTTTRWPDAPNRVFQYAANAVKTIPCDAFMWLEPDAFPVKRQWWKCLNDEYRRGRKPFMGTRPLGCGHMNGVAVYPRTTYLVAEAAMAAKREPWDIAMADEIKPYFHDSDNLIQHCGAVQNGKPVVGAWPKPSFSKVSDLSVIDEKAVIFHPCKDGKIPHLFKEAGILP